MTWHLAIIPKNCLSNVLSGIKVADGRFARVRCAPHGKVTKGDHVFLKELGGPIRGCATVEKVISFEDLPYGEVLAIVKEYQEALKVDSSYVADRLDSRYATIIFYTDVIPCSPLHIESFGRAGWVVLDQLDLPEDQCELALYTLAQLKGKLH